MSKVHASARGWLWLRFLAGILYLAVLAILLCAATNIHYLWAFAILLAGAVVSTILGLKWLTLWAQRKESQLGQFQIGSLFFLTALLAMLFGAVRWSVVRVATQNHLPLDEAWPFVLGTLIWLIAVAIALPLVLGMAEAVLWTSVWMIRQPTVRRAIRTVWPKRNCEVPGRAELRADSLQRDSDVAHPDDSP
jgi:hypothetical protein